MSPRRHVTTRDRWVYFDAWLERHKEEVCPPPIWPEYFRELLTLLAIHAGVSEAAARNERTPHYLSADDGGYAE